MSVDVTHTHRELIVGYHSCLNGWCSLRATSTSFMEERGLQGRIQGCTSPTGLWQNFHIVVPPYLVPFLSKMLHFPLVDARFNDGIHLQLWLTRCSVTLPSQDQLSRSQGGPTLRLPVSGVGCSSLPCDSPSLLRSSLPPLALSSTESRIHPVSGTACCRKHGGGRGPDTRVPPAASPRPADSVTQEQQEEHGTWAAFTLCASGHAVSS